MLDFFNIEKYKENRSYVLYTLTRNFCQEYF